MALVFRMRSGVGVMEVGWRAGQRLPFVVVFDRFFVILGGPCCFWFFVPEEIQGLTTALGV